MAAMRQSVSFLRRRVHSMRNPTVSKGLHVFVARVTNEGGRVGSELVAPALAKMPDRGLEHLKALVRNCRGPAVRHAQLPRAARTKTRREQGREVLRAVGLILRPPQLRRRPARHGQGAGLQASILQPIPARRAPQGRLPALQGAILAARATSNLADLFSVRDATFLEEKLA